MRFRDIAAAAFLVSATAAAFYATASDRIKTAALDFQTEMQSRIGSESAEDSSPSRNPHIKPYASIIRASIWDNRNIPVCWENGTDTDQQATTWTREAAEATWQKESGLKFVGWQNCANRNA